MFRKLNRNEVVLVKREFHHSATTLKEMGSTLFYVCVFSILKAVHAVHFILFFNLQLNQEPFYFCFAYSWLSFTQSSLIINAIINTTYLQELPLWRVFIRILTFLNF